MLIQIDLGCIGCTRVHRKVYGQTRNEIYAYNNKDSLRNNIKGYSGKTH